MSQKRMVIAGETHSPNLGDGVIAQSLAHLYQRAWPDQNVVLLDISARPTWGSGVGAESQNGRFKTRLQSLRRYLGNRTYNLLIWNSMKRSQSQALWQKNLQAASALIIGGGLLIMDNDLDFPLKINTLARTAQQQNVPIHFVACGVGDNRPWTPRGHRLMRQALSAAQTITLRDKLSQQKLARLMPDIETAVTFDPAICAQAVYGPPNTPSTTPNIGLGIIQVDKINAYNPDKPPLTQANMRDFWLKLLNHLYQSGLRVTLFSNGIVHDHALALEIAASAAERLGLDVPVAPRPVQPEQLVQTIARFSGVVAFRLHASIIASAYGIPSIGLEWDQKSVYFLYRNRARRILFFHLHE